MRVEPVGRLVGQPHDLTWLALRFGLGKLGGLALVGLRLGLAGLGVRLGRPSCYGLAALGVRPNRPLSLVRPISGCGLACPWSLFRFDLYFF